MLMSILSIIVMAMLIFFVLTALSGLYTWFLIKRSAKELDEKAFREQSRNQQILDVREHDSFVAGHIIGARNTPYFQLKEIDPSFLQKGRPVFVYSQTRPQTARAANVLRKKGYKDIYILKNGFDEWTGRTKKSK